MFKQRSFNNKFSPPLTDRLISAASYLTMGLAGFIWMIITAIQKKDLPNFLKYHIFQSIFFSVIIFVLGYIFNFLIDIVSIIPIIGNVIIYISSFLLMPVIENNSISSIIITLISIYLAIGSLIGKYSYFPFISDNVKKMIR